MRFVQGLCVNWQPKFSSYLRQRRESTCRPKKASKLTSSCYSFKSIIIPFVGVSSVAKSSLRGRRRAQQASVCLSGSGQSRHDRVVTAGRLMCVRCDLICSNKNRMDFSSRAGLEFFFGHGLLASTTPPVVWASGWTTYSTLPPSFSSAFRPRPARPLPPPAPSALLSHRSSCKSIQPAVHHHHPPQQHRQQQHRETETLASRSSPCLGKDTCDILSTLLFKS